MQAFLVAQKNCALEQAKRNLKKERVTSKIVELVLSLHQKVACLGMLLRWNGPARLSFSEDSLFWTKRCLDHGVAVDGTRELDIS